jgi:hypothetical protein
MQKIPLNVIVAALVSSLIFVATVKGVLLGVLVLLLPMVPLFWAGMRYGAVAQSTASLMACLVVMAIGGLPAGFQFILMIALPSWVFGRQLLKVRLMPEGGIEWFPIGGAFVAYALFGFMVMTLMASYMANSPLGGMLQVLQQDVAASAEQMDAEVAGIMQNVVTRYAYIILPAFFWGWGLLMYGCAWLAKELCMVQGVALRRSVALSPFLPPSWWFVPLLMSGAAALTQEPELRFAGLTGFFILLLPYFMCGIAMLDREVKRWPNAAFWRAGLYFLLFIGQWPVMTMVTFYGIFLHIAHFYRTKNT